MGRVTSLIMSKSALAITEEHRDLAAAAAGQLQRSHSLAAARATLENPGGHPSALWSAGANLGWNGLALAEEYGGSGFGLAELAVVAEVAGRRGGQVPVFFSDGQRRLAHDQRSYPAHRMA